MKFAKMNAAIWTFNAGLFWGNALTSALEGKTGFLLGDIALGIVSIFMGLVAFRALCVKNE